MIGTTPVLENVGIPMLAVVWPLSWLTFVPVVLIEAYVARRIIDLPARKCVTLALVANAWSTFLGIPLARGALLALEALVGEIVSGFKYPSDRRFEHGRADTMGSDLQRVALRHGDGRAHRASADAGTEWEAHRLASPGLLGPSVRVSHAYRGSNERRSSMHPGDKLLEWPSELDFAVLQHGLTENGRDYVVVVQDMLGRDPGTHEVTFTHCVQLDYETRVRDDVWPLSWTKELADYEIWQRTGEPDGYVWGTNWSNAYPGLEIVRESASATSWTDRLGKDMFEITLETDRFFLRLIFRSIVTRKLSDDAGTISQTIVPLPPGLDNLS